MTLRNSLFAGSVAVAVSVGSVTSAEAACSTAGLVGRWNVTFEWTQTIL